MIVDSMHDNGARISSIRPAIGCRRANVLVDTLSLETIIALAAPDSNICPVEMKVGTPGIRMIKI